MDKVLQHKCVGQKVHIKKGFEEPAQNVFLYGSESNFRIGDLLSWERLKWSISWDQSTLEGLLHNRVKMRLRKIASEWCIQEKDFLMGTD